MVERFSGNIIEITKIKNRFHIYCDMKLVKTTKCNIFISINPDICQYDTGFNR